jgi:hypothetical protein
MTDHAADGFDSVQVRLHKRLGIPSRRARVTRGLRTGEHEVKPR